MAKHRSPSPTPPLSLQVGPPHVPPTSKEVSAEAAELAGTLLSETSHIPSTEDEAPEDQYRHGLVFLLKYTEDGPVLDTTVDVSSVLGMEWVGMLAAEKLTGKTNKKAREVASAISMMCLRTRFDGACYGPYLVKFEDPTTPEELEQVLRAMEPNRRKAFLKGAAI